MKEFDIAGRKIGPEHPPLVIVEVGINHDGQLDKRIGKSIRPRLRCTARFGHSRAPCFRFDGAQ